MDLRSWGPKMIGFSFERPQRIEAENQGKSLKFVFDVIIIDANDLTTIRKKSIWMEEIDKSTTWQSDRIGLGLDQLEFDPAQIGRTHT